MAKEMINFGSGTLIAVPQTLNDGTAIANPTPVIIGTLQDVSLDLSTEIKALYGNRRYPVAIGQAKSKSEVKAKSGVLNGGAIGSLFYGKTAAAGIKALVQDQSATIPATPFTITIAPPNSGTFVADVGVFNAATGAQLSRVASAPTTGQYSVNTATGVYTFASADQGNSVLISYEYSANSGGEVYNLTNDLMGYTPTFSLLLQNKFDGKTMVVKFNRCVSGKLALPLKNDDFAVNDFEAEAFADAAGNLGYICLF